MSNEELEFSMATYVRVFIVTQYLLLIDIDNACLFIIPSPHLSDSRERERRNGDPTRCHTGGNSR